MWMRLTVKLVLSTALLATPALAQDIRGLEVCSAEKQMDRRTSCLQANARRQLAAADTEIAALKSRLAKLEDELAQLKKAAAANKPAADKK